MDSDQYNKLTLAIWKQIKELEACNMVPTVLAVSYNVSKTLRQGQDPKVVFGIPMAVLDTTYGNDIIVAGVPKCTFTKSVQ